MKNPRPYLKLIPALFGLLLVLPSFAPLLGVTRLLLPADDFSAYFHHIRGEASIASLRKEYKVVVPSETATDFLSDVRQIVGPENVLNRDSVQFPDHEFVTTTDYLPAFRGHRSQEHAPIFKGIIRIRKYYSVRTGTLVSSVSEPSTESTAVKLADGPEDYVKFEFKIGHPDRHADASFRDVEGVVEKTSVVLREKDARRLLESRSSFEASWKDVLNSAQNLRVSRHGRERLANHPAEAFQMMNRLAQLHRGPLSPFITHPELNIRYKRDAYLVLVPHSESTTNNPPQEIQITVDREIEATNYLNSQVKAYPRDERVVELKLPLEIARMRDVELCSRSLRKIAEIRAKYRSLDVIARGVGKRARAAQFLNSDVTDYRFLPPD